MESIDDLFGDGTYNKYYDETKKNVEVKSVELPIKDTLKKAIVKLQPIKSQPVKIQTTKSEPVSLPIVSQPINRPIESQHISQPTESVKIHESQSVENPIVTLPTESQEDRPRVIKQIKNISLETQGCQSSIHINNQRYYKKRRAELFRHLRQLSMPYFKRHPDKVIKNNPYLKVDEKQRKAKRDVKEDGKKTVKKSNKKIISKEKSAKRLVLITNKMQRAMMQADPTLRFKDVGAVFRYVNIRPPSNLCPKCNNIYTSDQEKCFHCGEILSYIECELVESP